MLNRVNRMHTLGRIRRVRREPRKPQHAQGVALIEVLVALLIFMLGVLGLVGLQASMTRAQTDSKVRADAAYLASELNGRMWSDLTNLAGYNGTGCASQARCGEWQRKVSSSLPGGTGAVTVNASSGDVAVTISWTMPSGETHQYVTHTTVAKAAN
ncbi:MULTISPECIES: type IV pilus modification PilV family protein [Variovorax]|uniref:type IV pilus modification PilV family protein n=1 Tax=Variovorax TaxID=34072 RepID=UPI00177C3139|nr:MULTISPECIES: prepilin-type N-terminal cleavage/methylation domain-containing protein [Variovorax]MBD9666165.1 pilus assembly protein PilV [Variovorax sp. VRV01]MDR6453081.1 type IV pilus assembly protein PilV [Variovorax paradoxus]